MKTTALLSLGILALGGLSLQAVDKNSAAYFMYTNTAPTDYSAAANPIQYDSVLDVAKPLVPLAGQVTTNTTAQLWDTSSVVPVTPSSVGPVTNGPGTAPAPVPETGSSFVLLALGLIGLYAGQRRLRAS